MPTEDWSGGSVTDDDTQFQGRQEIPPLSGFASRRDSRVGTATAATCVITGALVGDREVYRYSSASARHQQRQERRADERLRRGVNANPVLTAFVMTPVARSRRSSAIPLYVVRDTRLPAQSVTRLLVRTVNYCALTEPVYCRGHPSVHQRGVVWNCVWQGPEVEIPLLVTNMTDRYHWFRAATLVALAETNITIPVSVSPPATCDKEGGEYSAIETSDTRLRSRSVKCRSEGTSGD